tara:strand:- start:45 stop:518 length:474 start_codon:yes stop_codon:yes gene_type:complete
LKTYKKAYTISEVILNLLLISIIMGLMYSFVFFFSNQVNDFNLSKIKFLEYKLLKSNIIEDINSSVNYKVSGDTIALYTYSGSKIEYIYINDKISRKFNSLSSSYNIEIKNFEHIPSANKNKSLVKFDLELNGKLMTASFLLEKDCEDIINSNEDYR